MRVGLSELYLHLGWFFRVNKDDSGVAVTGPMNGGIVERADVSPLSRIRPFLNMKQELALQGLLIHLTGLLSAASNEPRLKVCYIFFWLIIGSISCSRI